MNAGDEREQQERVRERFTRSADTFARFALSTRAGEAVHLAELAAAQPHDFALDLACGPGTFTLAVAARVKFVCGLDLTPAILALAQRAMYAAGLRNVALVCGAATALPYRDAAFDLATCGYALHHMPDPAAAVRELARALRRGGRVAIVDLIVPEGAAPQVHNRIERARDNSHATTLTARKLHRLLESAGFHIRSSEQFERVRLFSDWMRIANWNPQDAAWIETRRLMEAAMSDDAAGYHARFAAAESGDGPPEIEFVQTALFAVGEKAVSA